MLVILFCFVLYVIYSQRRSYPKVFRLFSQNNGLWFGMKRYFAFTLFSFLYFLIRRRRNKHPDAELRMDDVMNLCSDPYAMSSVAFNCCDSSGNIFVARIGRRNSENAEIWLALRLADGRVLFHTIYPLSLAKDCTPLNQCQKNDILVVSAGGMEVHFVTPLKVLRFTYSGKMRQTKIVNSCDADDIVAALFKPGGVDDMEIVDVSMHLWFKAFSDPAEALSMDVDPWVAAHTIALEEWNRAFFRSLSKKSPWYRANVQQAGELRGNLFVGSEEISLSLHGLRTRTIGVRDWRQFNGYCVHCGRLNDGTVIALGVLSQANGFSHVLSGYLIEPSGKTLSISWSDLHLASLPGVHSPCSNLPLKYTVAFEASGKVYKLAVTRLAGLAIGHGINSSDVVVFQSLIALDLDGVLGYGSVEYQHGLVSDGIRDFLNHSHSSGVSERKQLSLESWELWHELDTPISTPNERTSDSVTDPLTPLSVSLVVPTVSSAIESEFCRKTIVPKRRQIARALISRCNVLFLNNSVIGTPHFNFGDVFCCELHEKVSLSLEKRPDKSTGLTHPGKTSAEQVETIYRKLLSSYRQIWLKKSVALYIVSQYNSAVTDKHRLWSHFDFDFADAAGHVDSILDLIFAIKQLALSLRESINGKSDREAIHIIEQSSFSSRFDFLVGAIVNFQSNSVSEFELEDLATPLNASVKPDAAKLMAVRVLRSSSECSEKFVSKIEKLSLLEKRYLKAALRLSRLEGKVQKSFSDLKTAVQELGRLLFKEGKLPDDQLIYYLTAEDIVRLTNAECGHDGVKSLLETALARRNVYGNRSKLNFIDEKLFFGHVTACPSEKRVESSSCNVIFTGKGSIGGQSIGSDKVVSGARLVLASQIEIGAVCAKDVLVLERLDHILLRFVHLLPVISGIVIERQVDELISANLLFAVRACGLVCIAGCSDITKVCLAQTSSLNIVANIDGTSGTVEIL